PPRPPRTRGGGPDCAPPSRAGAGANEGFSRAGGGPRPPLSVPPGYPPPRLAAAGIRRVEDLGHCTYADAMRFFSYRRSTHRNESDYGRHVNAIALAQ